MSYKKIYALLLSATVLSVEAAQECVKDDRSFLQSQYESIVNDASLIYNCYFQKKRSVTDKDRKNAPWAIVRVTTKGAGAIGIAGGLLFLAFKFLPCLQGRKPELYGDDAPKEIRQIFVDKFGDAVERVGKTNNIVHITLSNTNNNIDESVATDIAVMINKIDESIKIFQINKTQYMVTSLLKQFISNYKPS